MTFYSIVWAIRGASRSSGEPYLYYGTFSTRTAAIRAHTEALGKTWRECRAKGDRAVRVKVEFE